jgi:predicted PurR-regulated permease PerM
MEYLILTLRKPIFKRIFIFAVIGFLLYQLKSMMTLFLLTYVFVYILNSAQQFIYKYLHKFFPVKRLFIVIFLYLTFLTIIIFISRTYIPVIIKQTKDLIGWLTFNIEAVQNSTTNDDIYSRILNYVSNNVDIQKYVGPGGDVLIKLLTNIGTSSLYILLSLILSVFFMVEKVKISKFMCRFKKSTLHWMYDDTRFFFVKFTNSFGKVIQTQILISFINAMLSLIILSVLHFQNIIALTVMIFILGLIPVAGVFISLIPLTLIAYSGHGGINRVIYILILIAVLHSLESYILNPKFMSKKAKMPVFFTFLVLLISEHFLGVWGLIVGLPITMFLLDVLEVTPDDKTPKILAEAKLEEIYSANPPHNNI